MSEIKVPKFFTIDCETTLNGNADIGLGHPMCPDNHIVYLGFKPLDFDVRVIKSPILELTVGEIDMIICGHNLPFDLLHLYKNPSNKIALQKYPLWDTQLAEYLLSGQQERWSSLDDLSVKYGLPIKDSKIKDYFGKGIGAEKIPESEIVPYLIQDVDNTYAIAIKQHALAKEMNMLPLIESQMLALHATTEMMFNGLHVNTAALEEYTVEVVNDFVDKKLLLESSAPQVEDINSATQWSRYFFGGHVKEKVKEPVGLYKNGNTKYKTKKVLVEVKGVTSITPKDDWKSEKTGKISVDDEVLNYLAEKDSSEVAKNLLAYRGLQKQLSTYVQGLAKHLQRTPSGEDYIYGNINHTATVTGRLSSSNPNLQNISNNPIKKIFTSRFPGGSLVEVDFNQLEVVALAHITKDGRLIEDIESGTDIHSELYKSMYGRYPTKEERKPFKSLTFGLIYGAGVNTLAKNAKVSYDDARTFCDTFYRRYPKVKVWHDSSRAVAEKEGKHLKDSSTGLLDKHMTYTYIAETGRRLVFKEYRDDKGWSLKDYAFSPTELKNYPAQSLATGDIVPMMLGQIFSKWKDHTKVLMINTVHDSVLFDVHPYFVDVFLKDIKVVFENTHSYYEFVFGKPLSLKLKAGISVGSNWHDIKEI